MAVSRRDDFADRVRDAAELVDLVGEHTRLERRGKRLLGLCPFHEEKTPSFSVDPDRNLYYCFGCGAGGDAFRFHMQVTGDDFPATLESLARRYGVPIPERPGRARREPSVEAALEAARTFFLDGLRANAAPRRYLERRQVDEATAERYEIGFAPDSWRALHDALGRRHDLELLERAGLVARSRDGRPYDRFRNRLIFPIRGATGRLLGFGGRTLGDDRAKYINTAETESFHKGSLIYALHLARVAARESRRLVLAEGYFDVIGLALSGAADAVASMGTALTAQQARQLARYADEVVLAYDGDRAGIEAARKALPVLLSVGLHVRRARFPAGQDPDSLRLDEGPAAVMQRLEEAEDALEAEIARLPLEVRREPRRQAELADEIAVLLRAIDDEVVRLGYARRAAERLDVPAELLLRRGRDRASARPRAFSAPGREAEEDAPERERRERTPAWGLEGRVLRGLLAAPSAVTDWPAPEDFLDPEWRRLYEALKAVLVERPDRAAAELEAALRRRLDPAEAAVDRLAGLLLEDSTPSDGEETAASLEICLQQLRRLAHDRQLRSLASELKRAEREGDGDRFDELLERRQQLLRRRRFGPSAQPGPAATARPHTQREESE